MCRSTPEAIGCTAEQLAEVTHFLDKSLRWDVGGRVFRLVDRLPGKAVEQRYIQGKPQFKGGGFEIKSAGEVRAFIAECGVTDGVTDARVIRRLDEYERYERTGQLPDTTGDAEEEQQAAKASGIAG